MVFTYAGGAGGGALGRDAGDMGKLFKHELVVEARDGRIGAEEAGEHKGREFVPRGAISRRRDVEEVIGIVNKAIIEPADAEHGDVPAALGV